MPDTRQPQPHQPTPRENPPSLRRIVGWVLLTVGLLTFWLPIPIGIPLMIAGIVLVGRDAPTVRYGEQWLAQCFERMRHSRHAWVRWLGARGLRSERQVQEAADRAAQR